MIPKVIHYFWQSDREMPETVKKCMQSWREKLPEYQFRCWDLSNFDAAQCRYTREAAEAGQYAFVSDYVRLYALYREGGIYLDTDVEVLGRFDGLLENGAFAGFENPHTVATSLIGSQAGHSLLGELLAYYRDRPFFLPDGKCDLTPNTVPVTRVFRHRGAVLNGKLQKFGDVTLYPRDWFCPYDRASEKLELTRNSLAIHHFYGAWLDDKKKALTQKRKQVIRKYGKTAGYLCYSFGLIRCAGLRQFLKELGVLLKRGGS